ncbi:hypothetical protein QTI24_01495 [Variovorax sp. J22P240]|uniref:hypothetical protein n=1 Tax=Variovorax sp. J22P240 TaxID=3053514 RepID=UPI0025763E22|nr:hypothetical protein [Variovorax sp. J22P240]MDL9997256.1 hypothetical protein [Variovorax sp. J22P240]
MTAIDKKALPTSMPSVPQKVVELHPDQTANAKRRALRGTYSGKPYTDGQTVRVVRSRR